MRALLTAEQAEAVEDVRFWAWWAAGRRRAMIASGVPDCEARAWAKAEAAARERIAEEVGRDVAATGQLAITLGPDGRWTEWKIHGGKE